MQKEVEGKPVQKVQRYVGLKLTLHMICTLILSSIILNLQILTMEPFWRTILAGEQNYSEQPLIINSGN